MSLARINFCNTFETILPTTFVDPAGLAAFTACRVIALHKNQAVRPTGIGEVCRRLIAKSTLCIVRDDILQATWHSYFVLAIPQLLGILLRCF